MKLSPVVRTYLPFILLILFILTLGDTIYQRFFSGHAEALELFKKQVEAKEEQIANLQSELAILGEHEQELNVIVGSLRAKLANVAQLLDQGEGRIDAIKNEVETISDAINTIEAHARSSGTRARGLLPAASPGG